MIKTYHRKLKDSDISEKKEFSSGSWVHVVNPHEEELGKLIDTLKLDAGHVKDALDPFEAPRLEVEKQHIYVFTRVPIEEEDRISTIPFLTIIGKQLITTISRKEVPFTAALLKNPGLYTTQGTKLFLQIFKQINTSYQNKLAQINRTVRRDAARIERITNKEIARFVMLETILNDFHSSLVPQNNILNNLLNGKILSLYQDDKELVEDLLLGNAQLIERSRSDLKNIVNIREAHSTIATNNLNQVIKLLTAMTIIMTVPMIISSLYGMNVALPFADSPWAFVSIVIGTILISLLLIFIFIKNKWL